MHFQRGYAMQKGETAYTLAVKKDTPALAVKKDTPAPAVNREEVVQLLNHHSRLRSGELIHPRGGEADIYENQAEDIVCESAMPAPRCAHCVWQDESKLESASGYTYTAVQVSGQYPQRGQYERVATDQSYAPVPTQVKLDIWLGHAVTTYVSATRRAHNQSTRSRTSRLFSTLSHSHQRRHSARPLSRTHHPPASTRSSSTCRPISYHRCRRQIAHLL